MRVKDLISELSKAEGSLAVYFHADEFYPLIRADIRDGEDSRYLIVSGYMRYDHAEDSRDLLAQTPITVEKLLTLLGSMEAGREVRRFEPERCEFIPLRPDDVGILRSSETSSEFLLGDYFKFR